MTIPNTVWDQMELVEGDITRQDVDAIVNAANESLLGGGGVDGAIHHAAGPGLLRECKTLGGCPTGSARITGGYRLHAKHVIHAVGPVYRDGADGEPEALAGCYETAMDLADDNGCKSVAFPAISCGVYGYPMREAAAIAITTVARKLSTATHVRRVRFVLFGRAAYESYADVWGGLRR